MIFTFFIIIVIAFNPVEASKIVTSQPMDKKIDLIQYLDIYATDSSYSANQIEQLIAKGKLLIKPNKATQGFSNHFFWLRFSIDWSKIQKPLLLELNNPHIDFIHLYQKKDEHFIKIGHGGDKLAFKNRSYANRRPIFQLYEKEGVITYLLMVDKRGTSVSFPLSLWNATAFEEREGKANVFYWIFFGGLFLISFLAIIIGMMIKKRIFIYYGLYSLFTVWYLFTDLGYSFQYLYPDKATVNHYSKSILTILISLLLILYTNNFLKLNIVARGISKYLKYIFWFIIVSSILWFIFAPLPIAYVSIILKFKYLLFLSVLIAIVIGAIKGFPYHSFNSLIFFISFSCLILGWAIRVLQEYGYINSFLLVVHPVVIGTGAEILVFSIAMTHILKQAINEKTQLQYVAHSLEKQKNNLEYENLELRKEKRKLELNLHKKLSDSRHLITLKDNTIISTNEISYISSSGHYLYFYFSSDKKTVFERNSIKDILQVLPTSLFVQVHRSYIVNLKEIALLKANELELKNSISIPVSRKYKKEIQQQYFQGN